MLCWLYNDQTSNRYCFKTCDWLFRQGRRRLVLLVAILRWPLSLSLSLSLLVTSVRGKGDGWWVTTWWRVKNPNPQSKLWSHGSLTDGTNSPTHLSFLTAVLKCAQTLSIPVFLFALRVDNLHSPMPTWIFGGRFWPTSSIIPGHTTRELYKIHTDGDHTVGCFQTILHRISSLLYSIVLLVLESDSNISINHRWRKTTERSNEKVVVEDTSIEQSFLKKRTEQ